MNILITGGTGYVGSHAALLLAKSGHAVSVVARGSVRGSSSAERLQHLREAGVKVVLADLSVPGQLLSRVDRSGVQVIVHAVSNFLEPRGPESLTVRSMVETVQFARGCPGLRHVINLSNNLVLGDTAGYPAPDEDVTCRPNTDHGRNKLLSEETLRRAGLPWTILRISQVYGGPGSSFDWIMLDQIQKGKLPLPGNGQNRVGLVHIDDVCQAVKLVVEKRAAGVAEVFNICSGDLSLTQGELFAFLARCLKAKRPVRIPYPVALTYAFLAEKLATIRGREPKVVSDMVRVMAMGRVLNICKARELLGYRPAYPETLIGLEEAYAEVFAGQDKLFVPAQRMKAVRGGA